MRIRPLLRALPLAVVVACADSSGGTDRALPEPIWQVEPLARIGSLDDPAQSLTSIGQVVIGPEAQLFVSQPMDARLLIFDSAGALQASLGGRGQGPGEFQTLRSIGLLGDTLYASDQRLGRVSFFSLGGEFRESTPWSTPPPAPPTLHVIFEQSPPHLILPDGTALLQASAMYPVPPGFFEAGPIRFTFPRWYLRIDRAGAVVNTVAQYEVNETRVRITTGPSGFAMGNPFLHTPLSSIVPDGSGVVVVERDPAADSQESSFRVLLINSTADTVFSKSIPYDPIPLTEQHIHSATERASRGRAPHVVVPALVVRVDALRSHGFVPVTHVPVNALATGQDGTIWLQGPLVPDDGPVLWTVLGSSGDVEGYVRLPACQSVLAARGDVLIVQELDDLDVPYIIRYRLVR